MDLNLACWRSLMGYSAWLVSRRSWSLPVQALYYSQLLLNLAWQPSFFNFHKLTTALNVIMGEMFRQLPVSSPRHSYRYASCT